MQFYNVFYKRFGLRVPQQLMTPVVSTIDKFEFPKNSLYHFIAFDNVHYGPQPDDYLFRLVTKQILMDHVVELTEFKGTPKKVSAQILPYIREYHIKNRRFRYIKDVLATSRDENTLLIVNYGFVLKAYRYIRSIYAEYFKWWNIQKTVWKNINDAANENDRQQFVFFNLPKTLPSVATLRLYTTVFNQQMVKIFNNPESLFLLELWKWLDPDARAESIIGQVEDKNLFKINIVCQDGGKWMMFNLGVLNDWRYIANGEGNSNQKVKIDPVQLQRQFLRSMMSFMSHRSIPEDEVQVIDEEPVIVKKNNTDVDFIDESEPVEVNNDGNILFEPIKEIKEIKLVDIDEIDKEIIEDSKTDISQKLLDSLDEDLKELEVIENRILVKEEEAKTNVVKQKSFTDDEIDLSMIEKEVTPEENVIKYCDEMAEDGLISASEYKNLIKQSTLYKTIKSPFKDDVTLNDYAQIDPSEIAIETSSEMKDFSPVIDKTMLKSSLLDFDERYIKEILHKDVSGMMINTQKAGVILSNYEVEKIDDIMGDYEIHRLRVRPIQGTASTVIFKLPVVNDDGNFVNNGNKYSMRKMRGDLPIRKTAPDTVALTSYYGKTFVRRSSKKVNDYSQWIKNKVMSKGLDTVDQDITNLATGDFFDNSFKAPRIYSIMSQSFRSFTCGQYHFIFDYRLREQQINEMILKDYEKDSMLVVGYTDHNTYLIVDKEDAIYETNGKSLVLKGTLETIAKIDSLMAPVDCSEIKVFGKTISVGLILGYQLGLSGLMDLLKVSPRRILAGQRLNLESNEYAITFSDETLIFSKDDKLATIVLAGFNEYVKAIKNYNSETFDKPNVYYNVLESSGINGRYLKEIDLMNDLFVDPITKELLIEMKEPTSFKGLLVRSSQLLITENHPDLLDMKYMRIKGYERLAGAAYAEMIIAIRNQKGKSTKNKSPIELHPYAVWKRIASDPSITMVTDINPIADIKQKEAVTYSGTGGRNSRSMTKDARTYHKNDMGVISESTKDSSDVAINTYTSADPQFKSLRGTAKDYIVGETGLTALLSTSALVSVGSDRDDSKRVNNLLLLTVMLIETPF